MNRSMSFVVVVLAGATSLAVAQTSFNRTVQYARHHSGSSSSTQPSTPTAPTSGTDTTSGTGSGTETTTGTGTATGTGTTTGTTTGTATGSGAASTGATSACSAMGLGQGASLSGFVPFPANDPWRQNIASAPVDANSATLVGNIGSAALASGLWRGSVQRIIRWDSVYGGERRAVCGDHVHGVWQRERSGADADCDKRCDRGLSEPGKRRSSCAGAGSRQLLAV